MGGQIVTINSRNFDKSIRKSWTCELIERSGPLLVFVGQFDRQIDHPHLGRIERGTISYEYYWLDRWCNVFRFHGPDGLFRNYYCNICTPPTFEAGMLDYVDLDIDILVGNDWTQAILDEEEFEDSAAKYGFSDELRKKVSGAVDELIAMIEHRQFPFDR